MKKPVVGISTVLLRDISHSSSISPVTYRIYSNIEFINAVKEAGGIPLLIPITTDEELIAGYVDVCDAFLLHGGHDANPVLFGYEPDKLIKPGNMEADICDSAIVRGAIEADKPILGICRGMQIMNLAMGGSIYQDISRVQEEADRERPGEGIKIMAHVQPNPENEPYHSVITLKGTRVAEIFGEKTAVNSLHHLCVKEPARGAVISARASDGVAEAIEFPDKKFAVGVQWHPEIMVTLKGGEYREIQKRVFKALVEAAL